MYVYMYIQHELVSLKAGQDCTRDPNISDIYSRIANIFIDTYTQKFMYYTNDFIPVQNKKYIKVWKLRNVR